MAVVAAVVTAFFVAIYPARGITHPTGYDTPRYLWRTACVGEVGLDGLEECGPPRTPLYPSRALPTRPAYPLLTLPLEAVTGTSPFTVAAVLPGVAAALVALAAAVLVTAAIRAGPGTAVLVALVVGMSPIVVRLAGPEAYVDNMAALALGTGGLAAALAFAAGRQGGVAAVALLATAALAHWTTYALLALALAGMALLAVPAALRARQGGTPLLRTPAGRTALVVGGSAVGFAAVGLAALGRLPEGFEAAESELARKLRDDLPRHRLPLTLPLAAAGGVALWRPGREGRAEGRSLTVLLSAWLVLVGAGLLVWLAGRRSVPAHRLLLQALPLPILGGVALARGAALLRRGAGRAAAVTVAAIVLVAWGWLGWSQWSRNVTFFEPGELAGAEQAAAYLALVPERTVVVLVHGDPNPLHRGAFGVDPVNAYDRLTHVLRAGLPPDQVSRIRFFLGRHQDLEAGRPTRTGFNPVYDRVSRLELRALRPVLDADPVVLALEESTEEFGALAERFPQVAPGVVAVEGPAVSMGVATPASRVSTGGVAAVAVAAAGSLLALGLAGVGWTLALLGRTLRPFEVAALAPVVGVSAALVAGLVADRLGFRLAGGAGAATLAGTAVAGAAAAVAARRRRAAGKVSADGPG